MVLVFFVADVSSGIDVDAKTRTRVWKSSSWQIVTPLQIPQYGQ